MTLNIAELRRLEAEQIQEKVARHLCKLMDDEWGLGRKLYMDTAKGILDDIALPELLKALGWRDMSTAPRDGTKCLFFSPGKTGAYNENAREAHYRIDSFSNRWPSAHHQYPEAPYTHWMPLPLPPHGGVDVG